MKSKIFRTMKPSFRENATSGTWCCLLLPCAYLSVTYKNPHLEVSSLLLAIFTGLYSCCSAQKILTSSTKSSIDDVILGAFVIVFGTIQLFFLPFLTGLVNCVFLSFYGFVLPMIFEIFPHSFTFGEGSIVLQALCIFMAKSGAIFRKNINYYHLTSQLGLMSLIALMFLKKYSKTEWSLLKFCVAGVCLLTVFPVPYLWLRIGENPVAWIVSEIFDKPWRLQLMAIWIVAAASAIVVVCYELRSSTNWEKTRLRKVFHLFVTIAVAAGIFIDSDLTILATVAIFCVQILLEFVRVEEISPIADHLNMAFKAFLDEKDQGLLVLTNIYLLVGAASPLWLSEDFSNRLALLSGVISVGIGDSAASIIGSKYGKIHWPGSPKTLEGTVAFILSQVILASVLDVLSFGVAVAFVIVGLVEARTDQVDNLVLPILMFSIVTLLS